MSPVILLSVALGGALGATARFAFGVWAARAFGTAFPWGTLGVNALGGLLMGIAAHLLVLRGGGLPPWLAPGAMAGLLGGFTTFSAFAFDAVMLAERGEPGRAALYVGGSVAAAVGALILGLRIGRALA